MNIIQFIIFLKYILLKYGVVYQPIIQYTIFSEQVRIIWQFIHCITEYPALFGKSKRQCGHSYGIDWIGYVIL